MMSPKVSGANLPISSRWPGDSIWKQPSVWVVRIIAKVSGSSKGDGVQHDRLPADADHLVEGMGHRRLHPDAEHVELEEPHLLDGVLVELAHREPHPAGLHRGPVQQRPVAEQDAAGVQRDVPGQAVEGLHQVEEPVQAPLRGKPPHPGAAQLGQVGQCRAGIAGPDVRERLGEGVDLTRRQAERGPHVAHGMAHPVGVHHGHGHAALAAEPLEDPGVDLGAPGGLHVDVDVRQRLAQRGQEPLHDQPVLQGVDPGDAQQVVDQAARAGPPRGHPHAHLLDEVDDLGHGQEVAAVAEGRDGRQLRFESLGGCPVRAQRGEPLVELGPAAVEQHPVGHRGLGRCRGAADLLTAQPRGTRGEQDVELGDVHRADAQVGGRVQPAGVRQVTGRGQQPLHPRPAHRGGGSDLVRPPRASRCRP